MSKLNLNPLADWGYVNNSRFRFLSIRNQGGGDSPVPPVPPEPISYIMRYKATSAIEKPEDEYSWLYQSVDWDSDETFYNESTGEGQLKLKEDCDYIGEMYELEQLTSIEIPNVITTIGSECFEYCTNLTSVTLPKSITEVGEYIMNGTAWYEQQEDGVLYLGNWIIGIKGDPEEITTLNVRDDTVGICDDCFSESYLQTVTMPNTVKYLGDSAFYRSGDLTNVTLSNSLISLKQRTFATTKLSSITIPSSVVEIDESSFNNCSLLSSIKIDDSNPIYDSRNNCNAIIETSSNTLLRGCNTTIIPNTVTSIGNNAFEGSGITLITIPDSVTSIGAYAFRNCRNLATVTIGNGITIIEGRTFYDCSTLTTVTCYATMPPSLNDENFMVQNDTLYVPLDSVQAYRDDNSWNTAFNGNIQAIQE